MRADQIIEEALKVCDEAMKKTMQIIKDPERKIFGEGGLVVPREEVEKIKAILEKAKWDTDGKNKIPNLLKDLPFKIKFF